MREVLMTKILVVAFLTWAALTSAALAQSAGKRVALVVGNGTYRTVDRLTNPANDAKLIARTLQTAGFTLVGGGVQLDLDKAHFDRAVQDFGRAVQGADVALFYYSGHGMQVRGTNWLVPVDANPTGDKDLDFQMVDAGLVLHQMEGAGTKLNLVILDACRNNPFAVRGVRGSQSGLAEMHAPEGTLISYATQPGNVASDGSSGDSPYTKALAEAIRRPGLDMFQVFNQVGLAVKQETAGNQQPWLASSPISGNFYFFNGPVTINPPSAPSPDADAMFWSAIANNSDAASFQAYLHSFPDGRFSAQARQRLASLPSPPSAGTPPASRADLGRLSTIELHYDSVMDMVDPEIHPNILVHHNIQVTVAGLSISENRDRNARGRADSNASNQNIGTDPEGSYVSWAKAPDGRLIRIERDPQSTRTITVTMTSESTCRMDVADTLNPGFTNYAFLRVASHKIGYFTNYRVMKSSCIVQ